MSKTHHTIDYVELPVDATGAAKAFYAAAFGWTFQDYGPTYAALSAGIDGGFQADPAEKTPAPLAIVYSADLDASLAAVRLAGGEITRGVFDFPGGRRFHFRDPSGNELAVWSDR